MTSHLKMSYQRGTCTWRLRRLTRQQVVLYQRLHRLGPCLKARPHRYRRVRRRARRWGVRRPATRWQGCERAPTAIESSPPRRVRVRVRVPPDGCLAVVLFCDATNTCQLVRTREVFTLQPLGIVSAIYIIQFPLSEYIIYSLRLRLILILRVLSLAKPMLLMKYKYNFKGKALSVGGISLNILKILTYQYSTLYYFLLVPFMFIKKVT